MTPFFMFKGFGIIYIFENHFFFFFLKEIGEIFGQNVKNNLDVNSTTFAKIFIGKNRQILDITKLGKTHTQKKRTMNWG